MPKNDPQKKRNILWIKEIYIYICFFESISIKVCVEEMRWKDVSENIFEGMDGQILWRQWFLL